MRRRIALSAAFACVLALAGTALPAAAEDGTLAPAARTIPVAPVDPAGMKGRIVFAIADWLEQRFGSGSDGLKLVLDAPMRAEERGGTVTVHLPGARLARRPKAKPEWTFGDLAIAVTPRSGTAYDFESALPSVIEKRRERLTIGESAIAGTWRSDLGTTTGLDATAANLRLFKRKDKRKESAPALMSLGALAVSDEIAQGADGLWDGRSSFSLSDLEAEGLSLGGLDITGSFEDFDRDAILALRRDSGAFLGDEIGPEALGDGLALLVDGRWGRSDATLAVEDLTLAGDEWYVDRDGAFTLGRLVWRVDFDGREELSDLATRISVAEPALSGKVARSLPPAFMPHAVTVDVALTRFPLRRIAGAFSGLAERGHMKKPDEEMLGEVVLAHLDAADTAFEVAGTACRRAVIRVPRRGPLPGGAGERLGRRRPPRCPHPGAEKAHGAGRAGGKRGGGGRPARSPGSRQAGLRGGRRRAGLRLCARPAPRRGRHHQRPPAPPASRKRPLAAVTGCRC